MSDSGVNARTNCKFDDFADGYEGTLDRSIHISGESSEYFAKYKAAYVARHWRDVRGKVLDFGCGVGLLSRFLREQLPYSEIDGYDPSPESIRNVSPALLAACMFTSDLEEIGNRYEIIIIANVMHHIPPVQRQGIILELRNRLADRGRIVAFEHNPLNLLTRWAVAHCDFDDDAVLLGPKELANYFLGAGLEPRQDYIVFFPRILASLRKYEAMLRWCPLGAQYVTIGESQ